MITLTLHISDALLKNLLEGLGVLELLSNLGNNVLGQFLLLALLDLAFVSHPRVQNSLGLGSQCSLLLELVSLSLKLGSFLRNSCQPVVPFCSTLILSFYTLETSKRALVTSTTPPICWTLPIRFLTAWVWSSRAAFRMPFIFWF